MTFVFRGPKTGLGSVAADDLACVAEVTVLVAAGAGLSLTPLLRDPSPVIDASPSWLVVWPRRQCPCCHYRHVRAEPGLRSRRGQPESCHLRWRCHSWRTRNCSRAGAVAAELAAAVGVSAGSDDGGRAGDCWPDPSWMPSEAAAHPPRPSRKGNRPHPPRRPIRSAPQT